MAALLPKGALANHSSTKDMPGEVKCIEDLPEVDEGGLPVDLERGRDFYRTPAVDQAFPKDLPVRKFAVPYVVRVGGAVLAMCAGIVNVVSFLCFGEFTSHVTGTISKLGMGLHDSKEFDPGLAASLLASFLTGSTLCGVFIGKNKMHFGLTLYDFGLISISVLLLTACFASAHGFAKYLAAAACGLQNGLCTEWGGATIRTTHATGLLTDVGLLMGRILLMVARSRGLRHLDPIDRVTFQDDRAKLLVLITLGLSYLLGTYWGAHLHSALQAKALLVPAGITGMAGLAYLLYRVSFLKHAFFSAAEIDIVDISVAIYDTERVQENQPADLRRGVSDVSNLSSRSNSKEPPSIIAGSPDTLQFLQQSYVCDMTCTMAIDRSEMLAFLKRKKTLDESDFQLESAVVAHASQEVPETRNIIHL
eukprot:TRINITY_DN72516_c0_g1_i1.p1 TRINITY_DN72516_c0_g1~~TRINITY_DN72516_c0_g1_i1.p1  ORF type:complete len:421 (-),score=65.46 TRINITY_DN72516_c0_g1_i1:82-1344(-)